MFDIDLDFDDFLLEQELINEAVKDDIKEAESKLIIMMQHMLKHQYQPERQGKSWCKSIADSYNQYNDVIEDNKSKNNIENGIDLDKCYKDARNKALKETGLSQSAIPKQKPSKWNIDYITDYDEIIEFLKTNYNPNSVYNFKSKNDMEDFMNDKLKN